MTAYQLLKETIGMFIEYRYKHGYSEDQAKEKAILEMLDPDSGITITIEQKEADAV